ncbi:MAG: acyltransferase [Solirubrobacterales bacterium]
MPGRPLEGGREAPDAVAPPPRHPRFPLFDGLRAIAVISVVALHSWVAASGGYGESLPDRMLAHLNIGVTIFFVISGFLLYRPFIAHRAGGAEAPSVGDYAKRRILRIYPAYWLITTVMLIVPGLSGGPPSEPWHQYLLLDTPGLYGTTGCWSAPFDCGLANTWSLVVELTFYVALPFYAIGFGWVLRKLAVRSWARTELAVLAALSALSFALRFSGQAPFTSPWFAYSVLGTFYWFSLGMGLAVVSVGLAGSGSRAIAGLSRRPGALWICAAALYAALAILLPGTPFLFDRSDQAFNNLAFGAVALLLVAPAVLSGSVRGPVSRVLGNRLVAWIGLISYGIFLWHYAFTLKLDKSSTPFAVVFLLTLLATIPCAAASYYLLERPILRLKYQRIRGLLKRRYDLEST